MTDIELAVVAFIFSVLIVAGGIMYKVTKTRREKAKEVEARPFGIPARKSTSPSDLAYMKDHNLIDKPAPKRTTYVPTPVYSSPPVQTSSRSFLDDAADIAMIANTVHHWNDNERSVGVSTTVREETYTPTYSSSSDDSSSSSSSYSSSSSDSSYSSSSSDSSYSSSSSDW